jgi:hypothetical protein
MRTRTKESMPHSGEQIVERYFKCMDSRDVDGILDLFDYDAVVYEPFSKVGVLHGKSAIEPFLKVAMMANSELRRRVKIEKIKNLNDDHHNNNRIVALITFEKGEKVKGRFTFEFTDDEDTRERKIKSLHIEFL